MMVSFPSTAPPLQETEHAINDLRPCQCGGVKDSPLPEALPIESPQFDALSYRTQAFAPRNSVGARGIFLLLHCYRILRVRNWPS